MEYGDPRGFLVELGKLEPQIAKSTLPRKVRTLRTNRLKLWRERREAALFCHFMGERLGTKVLFAPSEAQDYDFVATWEHGDCRRYAPTQLKEVVPAHLNPKAEMSGLIDKLTKYTDSRDLSVAVHLNRQTRFTLDDLTVPGLPLASLWVFGAISSDASRWGLWGDFLRAPTATEHEYPAA